MRPPLHALLMITLAMAAVGCGCGPYEERLQRTQTRLAQLDEEDRLLGEPPVLPMDQGLSVFLRPPRLVQDAGTTTGSPAPDWLLAFPWHDPREALSPLDMFVGVHPCSGSREDLEASIQGELSASAEEVRRINDAGAARDIVMTRLCSRPADQVPVRYRRLVLQTLEMPPGATTRRPVPRGPCYYRLEVFLHEVDDLCVVIAFKLLDREATERSWKALGAGPAELRRLPTLDRKTFNAQRDACLATLRTGLEAQAARKAWKGGPPS